MFRLHCLSKAAIAAVVVAFAATVPSIEATAKDAKIGAIEIMKPWTRATPTGAKVAGGFMMIKNTGTETDRLIGGTFEKSARLEVHEMKMVGDVMKMRELDRGLEIAPGQSVTLKPGSYHVMFMELSEPLAQGGTVKGTLEFEKAGKVTVTYTVEAMGKKGGMKQGSHSGMGKH